MTADLSQSAVYTDFQALAKLKVAAREKSPGALAETARQFEAVFLQMMLKAMDKATPHDGMLDSRQGDFYRGMFNQQLATTLANGRGLGIADMLMRQLGGAQAGPSPAAKPAMPRSSAGHEPRKVAATASPKTAANLTAPNETQHWQPQSQQEFVRALRPYARRAAKSLGVAPRALLAQAALETGWGKHMPRQSDGSNSFNLFSVKAGGGWHGTTVSASTQEYLRGKAGNQQANFRAYDSIAAGFRDYVSLLQGSPRYSAALHTGDDVGAFADALQRAGYATDPDYAAKLQATAENPMLMQSVSALKSL